MITSATSLAALDPGARTRLASLHPVFADPAALPGEATLDEVADALDLPVAVLLAAASNEIRVTVIEGQGCGCSCGGGKS
ncbi:hypothetical protein [Azospirillum sp. ST 5-10]|uniref:hypothetical protein n=1 Tax=unclassified Azospirillum TaxID=2630922 RepID=UPI003F4A39A3